MPWLLAVIGLVLGIAFFIHSPASGAAVGFMIGWLLGAQLRQSGRIRELEQRMADQEYAAANRTQPEPEPAYAPQQTAAASAPVEPVVVAPPPAPMVSPAPEAPVMEAPVPSAPVMPAPVPGRAVFDLGSEPAVEPVAAAVRATSDADLLARERAEARANVVMATARVRGAEPPPSSQGFDLGATIKRWITDGNVPVKIGVLVLFIGIASALKYAVDQNLISFPIEMRLAAIGLFAMVGLVFGWRQREERRAFALSVQGGAVGVLLLTIFAAYHYYHLLPTGLTFGLVLTVVAGAAMLAVLQDAIALAVLAQVGGFLAPVLINTGSGNHVALFSYYAVLNAAIFAIAWYKPWRVLNLVGFAFTFIVGFAWGRDSYVPGKLATTEPFLVLFFLFYVAIAVLYSLRRNELERGTGFVDGTLVFGTPLVVFPLQAALLRGDDMMLAYSALAMAAVYGVLARFLWNREGQRTLSISFAALSLGFATLAVPIALSARWTACTWALEGVALVWLGMRDRRTWPILAGMLLQFLAGVAYVEAISKGGENPLQAILNGRFLSGALLALAALASAFMLRREERWRPGAAVMLLVGCVWWATTGIVEIEAFVAPGIRDVALLFAIAGTLAVFALARRQLDWDELSWPMLTLFVLLPLGTLSMFDDPPMDAMHVSAWLAVVAGGAYALRSLASPVVARGVSLAHIAWLVTLVVVAGIDLHSRTVAAGLAHTAWSAVSWIVPLFLAYLLAWRAPAIGAFPLADEWPRYSLRWFVPASMALVAWWLLSLLHDGDVAPLPYLPLVNPLELAQLAVLALLFSRWRAMSDDANRRLLGQAGLAAGFVMLSIGTLRGVHHLANLPWDPSLLGSSTAQTSLTVAWSVVGVLALVAGSRRASRPTWLVGSLIMGVVLAKLLLVDRTYIGNLQGIISFIVVGLLFTTVGYFAPTPPREVPAGSAA